MADREIQGSPNLIKVGDFKTEARIYCRNAPASDSYTGQQYSCNCAWKTTAVSKMQEIGPYKKGLSYSAVF